MAEPALFSRTECPRVKCNHYFKTLFQKDFFCKAYYQELKKKSNFFLKNYITVWIRYFFDKTDPYNFKESFDFYRKVGFTKNLFWKSRFLRWWLHLFQGLALLLHSIFLVTYLHFFTSFYMAVSGTVRGCKCSTEWAWTSGERSCPRCDRIFRVIS